jgi:hypothetical protein
MVYLYENIRWVKNLTKNLYFDGESFFSEKNNFKVVSCAFQIMEQGSLE